MRALLLGDVSGEALTQFGGRLHPVVLHLPIGLLVGVALLEIFSLLRRKPLDQAIRAALVWLTAVCAIFTMVSGLLLSRESSYGGDALQTHKLLGIGVAIGATLAAVCVSKSSWRRAYGWLLVVTIAVSIPAGHFGGTMTHGEGFLTAPFAAAPAARSTDVDAGATPAGDATGAFASAIAPIINDRCLGCHSKARHKGGLAMHTAEALFAGSEAGPVLVAGDAAGSEMIIRLRLPIDDKAHMPPGDKPQPTETEIAAIEQWINAGAPVNENLTATNDTGPNDTSNDDSLGAPAAGESDSYSPPRQPPAAALQALLVAQVHVEQVDPTRGLLWIDFAGAPDTDDARADALLTPLLDWIGELSLAGTKAGDGASALAARMPNLRTLDLSRTACSTGGLNALRKHATIEELRLTQVKLDDTAIDALASLPNLSRVYLWGAGVSPEAASRLQAHNAKVLVDVGAPAGAEALETEGAIALSSEAPAPGAVPAGAAAVSLAPVNAACPVSGAAINPKFAIVHEGKVIAFCCQDCAAKFWADPAKYPLPPKP